jgi:hypothetical protein
MVADALKSEIKRLKNLKNYRKLDDNQLESIARKNLWKKQISIGNRFSDKEDKKLAEDKFDSYLENYHISTFDEVQNIADLVYEESIKEKIQIQIEKIVSDKDNNFIPDKQIASMHDIEKRIWDLKEKIGISKEEKVDDLTALEELKKKFNVYIPFNRNEFTLVAGYKCSACGKEDVQSLLLRRRVKNFDVLKHPALSGRFLYNVDIMNDVRNGELTKEKAAKYLKTSPQYIQWVLDNEFKIINIDNVPQKDVDNFVDENPHLRNSHEYCE